MTRIAVVILNWNGRDLLERFIPLVIKHTTQDNCQIWVADNGSGDDSVSYLKENHPQVNILEFDRNYGFAGGYNRALGIIKASYYVLLNSDVETSPGWLEPMIRVMEGDLSIAACQPKIKSLDERDYFEHAGAAGGFIDFLGYPFCRGRIFDVTEKDTGQYNNECNIFWASGACMMVRAETWHNNQGFDSNFFAHMEEIDYCWRVKNRGYKIMVTHKSEVYHQGGASLPKSNPRKTFLNFRNNLLLLWKNLPPKQMPWFIILRMLFDWMSVVKFLAALSVHDAIAVLMAHISFITFLPEYIKKRKELQRERKRGNHPEVYLKSIVFEFFIRKKRSFSSLKF